MSYSMRLIIVLHNQSKKVGILIFGADMMNNAYNESRSRLQIVLLSI